VSTDAVSSPSSVRAGLSAEGTHRDAFTPSDWGLFAVSSMIWGASFLFIAMGLESLQPGVVTFGRIAIGAATLACMPRARVRVDRSAWRGIIGVSISWLAFPMTLFPLAQRSVSSSLAGMLNGGIPITAAAVATFALRRVPGRFQRYALVLGALGMVCLGLPSLSDGRSNIIGVGLVLLAISSYGVAVNMSVPLVQQYGSLPIFWRCQLVACVLTLPYAFYGLPHSSLTLRSGVAMLLLGSLGTAVAFVAMATLGGRVGSTRSSAITYCEAIIALGLGVLVRHEKVRPLEYIGCAIILAAAYLASRAET
jgi:drug/metabolite transporter (DMT)-like permease